MIFLIGCQRRRIYLMSAKIDAVFEHGVFRPLGPVDIREGEFVAITISDPYTVPPLVTDEAERARLLKELVREMKQHPLSGDAPHFTREDLHERR
jgi:predicted DNA-binding antitoxin AbrB/MazE fold protein